MLIGHTTTLRVIKMSNSVYVLDGLVPVARMTGIEEADTFVKTLKQGEVLAGEDAIASSATESKIRLIRAALRVLKDKPKVVADDMFQAAADRVKKDGDLKKKQTDVAVAAGLLWADLESFNFASPVKQAERGTSGVRPSKCRDFVRAKFPNVGVELSMAEIVAGSTYSEATIRTAFYNLKSLRPQHQDGPRMTIKHILETGKYKRVA